MIMTENNVVKKIPQKLVVLDNYSIFGHNDIAINILIIIFTYNFLNVLGIIIG